MRYQAMRGQRRPRLQAPIPVKAALAKRPAPPLFCRFRSGDDHFLGS